MQLKLVFLNSTYDYFIPLPLFLFSLSTLQWFSLLFPAQPCLLSLWPLGFAHLTPINIAWRAPHLFWLGFLYLPLPVRKLLQSYGHKLGAPRSFPQSIRVYSCPPYHAMEEFPITSPSYETICSLKARTLFCSLWCFWSLTLCLSHSRDVTIFQ